jgi:hypothetical protein
MLWHCCVRLYSPSLWGACSLSLDLYLPTSGQQRTTGCVRVEYKSLGLLLAGCLNFCLAAPYIKDSASCSGDHHVTGLPVIFAAAPSIVTFNPTNPPGHRRYLLLPSQRSKLDFSNLSRASSKRNPLRGGKRVETGQYLSTRVLLS